MTEEKKSMVPKLRFPGFNETWEQRKLGELAATFGYGLNAAAKSFDGRHKYIRITDIDESTRRFLCSSLTSPDIDFEEAAPYRLAEGDVLFARTGASVGKSYRYVRTDGEVYFAGFLIRFRFKDKEAAEFVFQNSLTAKFQNFIKTSSQRSGQPGINAQQFSGYQIAVPNSEERERIGSFFSRLDTAITLHQRKLEGLSKLKKSLLQKMFPKNGQQNPEVRFPGFTEAWEQRKLEELASKFTGGGTPNTSNPNYWNGEIPWIQSSDLKEDDVLSLTVKKHISQEGLKNSATKIVPKNSLVIVTRVGVGKLVVNTQEIATSQDFLSLSGIKGDSRFLAYSLYSLLKKITRRVQGTSIKGITKTDFLKETILVPALEEQEKISSCMVEVDKLITLHQRKLESLKKLKKSLLQQMFV